ncbi:RNA-binding protein [Candidatus Bathyarchaeota archaeon ex4484_205]|nr:MAG: RNA-binding protein [Candidatus Bathyarchaeota archaeon ex4484_205]
MKKKDVVSGEFVVPGDFLGVIEEFIPGEGTYEEGGEIFSKVAGIVLIDMQNKKISVYPKVRTPITISNGDDVIGRVEDVRNQAILVRIDLVKKEGREKTELLGIPILGGIHISQVSDRYINDLSAEFQPGDIVKAKVINSRRNPVQLSTVGEKYGVIKAYCTNCRSTLVKRGIRLYCRNCGSEENRKISLDYGKGVF